VHGAKAREGLDLQADGTAPVKEKSGFLDDAKGGFRYLLGQRGLLYMTVVSAFQNVFFAMTTSFFVIYVTKVLAGDATVYGIFLALFSLGVGPGSLLVGRVGAVRWAGKLWLLTGAIQGVTMIALVSTSDVLVAFIAVFIMGLLLGFVNTTWLTTVQLIVPSDMQGRYFGLDQLGSFATIPLGQIIGAYVIAVSGVSWAFALAGAGMIAVSVCFLPVSALRNMSYRGRGAGPGGRDLAQQPAPS
jgi:MFS family permease